MAMLKKMIILWICLPVQDHGEDIAKEDDHAGEDGLAKGHDHTDES